MPVGEQFRQLGKNLKGLGKNIKDIGVNLNNGINENIKDIGRGINANIENLKLNVMNMRNSDFTNEAAFRSWSSHYDTTGITQVRSMRKLFDIVEQKYPWISIIFLLINMGMETTAVTIFLICAHKTTLDGWVSFEWSLGYFITEVILSIFFLLSWSVLLSTAAKKQAYLLQITSIMTYLSAGWMLILGILAVVTHSRSWTRTYAPMFLRIWWLHECVLTLLDYPQISAFFTENRLQMARSMIQCMAVIGISVGVLQVVESFDGDPMGYFDVVYMMLLTFSTIGYGDIYPTTTKGHLVLIGCIFIGLNYFVPILEYIADLGKLHLLYKYYRTWFKRTQHIVICGTFNYDTLRIQLRNIFGGKRFYLNLHVVVMIPEQPSTEILLLLNAPKYRGVVTLLVGDPANTKDLDRCNSRGSAAVFLFGEGITSLYYSDYATADQAMTVAAYLPTVPLFVLLHRARYTRSIIPKRAKVVECERLCHCLLGLGCVLPGMVPLVGNLIRVFDPMATLNLWKSADFADAKSGAMAVAKTFTSLTAQQREIFSYDTFYYSKDGSGTEYRGNDAFVEESHMEPPWKHLYEASLAQHVEVLPFPAAQQERSFKSLVTEMYKVGITVLGVVRDRKYPTTKTPLSPTASPHGLTSPTAQAGSPAPRSPQMATPFVYASESVVELAPSGDLFGVEKLVVICDKRSRAERGLKNLPPLGNDDYDARVGFDDPQSKAALKRWVESPTSRGHKRFSCQSLSELVHEGQHVSHAESNASLESGEKGKPVGSPLGTSVAPKATDAINSFTSRSARAASFAVPGERVEVIRVLENAHQLEDHFVYIDLSRAHKRQHWSSEAEKEVESAKAADYFDTLRPARQHRPLSQIVLLAGEENYNMLGMMWREDMTGYLNVIHGCGLFLDDLKKCNLEKAAAVVIFSAGDRCDDHSDTLAVLVARTVRHIISQSRMNLGESAALAQDVPLVVEFDTTDYMSLISEGVDSSMHEEKKSKSDFAMEPRYTSGNAVYRHMLDTSLQEAYFLPELQQVLDQLLSGHQDTLLVTSMAVQPGWKIYHNATEYAISCRMLPLAIHRLHEEGEWSFRFPITNPPPPFPLRTDDILYCLKVR